ncbi:MAG: sensor histidine kinase [Puniceicoccales bacterium]
MSNFTNNLFAKSIIGDRWCGFLDSLSRREWSEATEERRISRIQTGFAVLGLWFGVAYALFYAALLFWAGVGVILMSTALMGFTIPMQRAQWGLTWIGNWLTGVLVAGFTALVVCEGGVSAHAAAWLASAPLCALMLVGSVRAAIAWGGVALCIIFIFFVLESAGVRFEPLYNYKWHVLVTGLGFMGLGPFMFAVVLTFEVTRHRAVDAKEKALQALASANERLQKLNEEKDQFLGIAAHDLRNPLGLIDGFAQIMEMNPQLGENDLKNLDRIRSSSKRMAGILDDLLNLNRIEQGEFPLEVKRHDLLASVKESIASVRMNAEKKSIRIDLEADEPPYHAQVDARALEQVLTNLMSNAVKYSEAGTVVSVVCYASQFWTSVEIIDQGPGFSREDRNKMYGRFAKLSAKPTGGESSTGLGLSIVRRITLAMKGQVECLPGRDGVGTCFRVSFPSVEAEEPVLAGAV